MRTLPLNQLPTPRSYASGLYFRERLFMFRDRCIMLGRSPRCHIRLEGRHVSKIHALLELRDGVYHIENASTHGSTFVDGLRVEKATPLWVGNVITLGQCKLVAVDQDGRFPISVYGFTDLCNKAVELAGGQRAAGRLLGRHHTFIARGRTSRATRQQTKGS